MIPALAPSPRRWPVSALAAVSLLAALWAGLARSGSGLPPLAGPRAGSTLARHWGGPFSRAAVLSFVPILAALTRRPEAA